MASYREGRARTSVAWEHFEIKDKDRGVATCNHCHDSFSYRTSVSNLMKHLRGKHGYSMLKNGDEDPEGGTDTENEEKGESKHKIKSEAWEYFEVKDEDNKIVTCSLCLDQFSYRDSLSPLIKHLKGKHSIDFGKGSDDEKEFKDDDDDDEDNVKLVSLQNVSENRGRNKSSAAWEYFQVKDDDRKVAKCNLCGALCSYRTSVSNLMKHARRKHNLGGRNSDDDEGNETVEEGRESKLDQPLTRPQRSIVWLYFKCVDPDTKLSQCLICKKLLSHSTTLTNLKKHLARKHPNVKIPVREDGRKRILLSSGGELYEVDAGTKLEDDDELDDDDNVQSTVEMDTVYLEDFDALDEENQPKKRKLTKSSKNMRTRIYSSSSDEEITFVNRYTKKHSDSFDHFGKYVASLLRNMPKEASSQLQTNFIKQIMAFDKNGAAASDAIGQGQDYVVVAQEPKI